MELGKKKSCEKNMLPNCFLKGSLKNPDVVDLPLNNLYSCYCFIFTAVKSVNKCVLDILGSLPIPS